MLVVQLHINRESPGPGNAPQKPTPFRNAQHPLLRFILLHLGPDYPYADRAFLFVSRDDVDSRGALSAGRSLPVVRVL